MLSEDALSFIQLLKGPFIQIILLL
jgi:hypothetical protein